MAGLHGGLVRHHRARRRHGERPPIAETAREWLEWGAYKALELMVSPAVDVSNAPTGESVDVDGDDFGMAFGLLCVAGAARTGLTSLSRAAAPGVPGLLGSSATTAAGATGLPMAASSGASTPQTYGVLTRFYRYAARIPFPHTIQRGPGPMGMTENAWGRITLFPEAIAKYARAKGLDPVGEAWATLRHEMTHTARVFAFRATGQVQTKNAYLNARGRGLLLRRVRGGDDRARDDRGGGRLRLPGLPPAEARAALELHHRPVPGRPAVGRRLSTTVR